MSDLVIDVRAFREKFGVPVGELTAWTAARLRELAQRQQQAWTRDYTGELARDFKQACAELSLI